MENTKVPTVRPKLTIDPIKPTLALSHLISISIIQEKPISSSTLYFSLHKS